MAKTEQVSARTVQDLAGLGDTALTLANLGLDQRRLQSNIRAKKNMCFGTLKWHIATSAVH